jgi:hypothetical protein
MADEKALKHALTRLRGFRSHIFGLITEGMVNEYHSILSSLQTASGEDLAMFYIPRSMMRPHIIPVARQSRSIPQSRFEAQLTSSKYCDKEFFESRMTELWKRFADGDTTGH